MAYAVDIRASKADTKHNVSNTYHEDLARELILDGQYPHEQLRLQAE